jgi:hypothetical protein
MRRPRSDVGLSTGNVPGFRRWMWKPYPRVGCHKSRSVSGLFNVGSQIVSEGPGGIAWQP